MYGAAERIHCTNARAVAELAAGSTRGARGIGTVVGGKAGAIITSVSAWAREATADVRSRRVIAYNCTSLVRLLPPTAARSPSLVFPWRRLFSRTSIRNSLLR